MKVVFVILLIFIVFLAPYPFPIKTLLQRSVSPDKMMVATFYWSGSGLMGVISKANPWVYLEVLNADNSEIEKYNTWADTPCDGVERLKNEVSWEFEVCDDMSL